MKNKIKKFFQFIFLHENEYTKKWMARFTVIVFILLIFYPFLSQELLLFHFHYGLSYKMCSMLFSNYTKFAMVLITGYSVTFLGQMGKAFLAKQNEENIKLKKQLSGYEQDFVEDEIYEESEE